MSEVSEFVRVDRVPYPQGDVLFCPVDEVPKSARQVRRQGRLIVRHSDAGHHHVIDAPNVSFFETDDPLVQYLVAGEEADVVHLRAGDPHPTLRLAAGAWAVHGQGEPTPEGWQGVID